MRLSRGTILEAALVAAQSLLNLSQRLVGAGVGVDGIRIRLERNSGIQMQRAVGAEAETILAQGDMAGIVAVEIFPQHFVGPLPDASPPPAAHPHAFSRHPQSHY